MKNRLRGIFCSLKPHAVPFGLSAAVGFSPALFLYSNNVLSVRFSECLLIMLAAVLFAVPVYAAAYWLFRLFAKGRELGTAPCTVCAGLTSAAFLALFLNANFVRAVLENGLKLNHGSYKTGFAVCCAVFVLFAVCVAAIVLLSKKRGELLSLVCSVLLIVSLAMSAFNVVLAVPDIAKKIRLSSGSGKTADTETLTGNTDELRNIYYLILDEYAAFGQMEKYYGTDCADMRSFLESRNFNVSENSLVTVPPTSSDDVSPGTMVQIANLCHLDTVASASMSDFECSALINTDSPLFSTLGTLGYDQYQVSSSENLLPVASLLKRDDGFRKFFTSAAEDGRTVLDISVDNSLISDIGTLTDAVVRRTSGLTEHAKSVTDVFDFYDGREMLAYTEDAPCVFYSYLECPHTPFRFDADGNVLDRENIANWDDPEFYLGQYAYTTKRTMAAVDSIISCDPDAVIIIQSDHGLRHTPGITAEDSACIFNAVYCGGHRFDISGMTSIDTMKYLLDTELRITSVD